MPQGDVAATFLESALFRFEGLKKLGDGALAQLEIEDLHASPGPESNSIAVILQHLHGNMRSRWTDFLTSDGDKPWRDRDGEFASCPDLTRDQLIGMWEEGWDCLLDALRALRPDQVLAPVVIRGQTLSALDAIHRQLAHYGYHVGQIVYLARMRRGHAWKTLSIPRGGSRNYVPTSRD